MSRLTLIPVILAILISMPAQSASTCDGAFDRSPERLLFNVIPHAGLNRALHNLVGPFGLNRLNEIYRRIRENRDPELTLFEKACIAMDFNIIDVLGSAERIPSTGGLLIIVNHPRLGADAISTAALVSRVRSDIKIFANEVIEAVPQFKDNVIGADPIAAAKGVPNSTNQKALVSAIRWLREGHALIIHPAGVPSMRKGGVVNDYRWHQGVVTMLKRANPQVLPVFVEGGPTPLFNMALKLPKQVTPIAVGMMAAFEVTQQVGTEVRVRIGEAFVPISVDEPLAELRAKVYELDPSSL